MDIRTFTPVLHGHNRQYVLQVLHTLGKLIKVITFSVERTLFLWNHYKTSRSRSTELQGADLLKRAAYFGPL